VAQEIGSKLIGGEVIGLVGDLGAGKTTFVQGLAHGLGISKNLNSPTYIIVRTYKIQKDKVEKLYHVDLYRLEENISEELVNLGLSDEMGKPENVIVIEWAEKAREALPKNTKWIEFDQIDENKRKIIIK
jgi:tRNA threonylcarbamoyladenosine biosynthesis protein TsaE